ncbi:MAG: hypothetical protein ACFCUE_05405 [Candidatus Bathyarchaeia archaeon]|jgi:hypothetical protein
MKKSALFPLSIVAIALICSLALSANATYNVTSNVDADPENVMLGTNVVITATTDEDFTDATFTWTAPSGVKKTETVAFAGTPKTASSSFTVDEYGVWKVTIFSSRGTVIGTIDYLVNVGFNVVPELPLLGTAGAAIAMIGGFVYFKKRNVSLI